MRHVTLSLFLFCGLSFAQIEEIRSFGTQTCARFDDYTMKCWGNLPLESFPYQRSFEPRELQPLDFGRRPVTAIGAGSLGNCAILEGAAISCWIYNRFRTALGLPFDFRPTKISESGECALGARGDVVCWGPLRSIPIERASDIATGESFRCAVVNGEIECWDREIRPMPSPTQAQKAKQIAAQLLQLCAVLEDGEIQCWKFERGTGWKEFQSPGFYVGSLPATSLSCGVDHCCAAFMNDTVKCWGARNDFGQLGVAPGRCTEGFLDLPRGMSVKQVSAGGCRTCILTTNDEVYCVGCGGGGTRGVPVRVKF